MQMPANAANEYAITVITPPPFVNINTLSHPDKRTTKGNQTYLCNKNLNQLVQDLNFI